MPPAPLAISRLQVERTQPFEVLPAQLSKLIQQLRQRLPCALARLRQAVELVEWLALAGFQYSPRPRHPVGALSVDEMSHNVERAPHLAAFIARGPRRRQLAQQCVECFWSMRKQRNGGTQVVFHPASIRGTKVRKKNLEHAGGRHQAYLFDRCIRRQAQRADQRGGYGLWRHHLRAWRVGPELLPDV